MTDDPANRTLTDEEMHRIEELHQDVIAFARDRGKQLGIELSYISMQTSSNFGLDFTDDADLEKDDDKLHARLEGVICHALAVGEALEADLEEYARFIASSILDAHDTLGGFERTSLLPSVLSEGSN